MGNLDVIVELKARDHDSIMYSLAADRQLKFLIHCSDKWRVLNIYFKFFQHCIEERKIKMEAKKQSMGTDCKFCYSCSPGGRRDSNVPSCSTPCCNRVQPHHSLLAATIAHEIAFYSSSVKHKHFKWYRVLSSPTSLQLNETKT